MAKRFKRPPKDTTNVLETLRWAQRAVLELVVEARKEGKSGTMLAAIDRAQRGAALIAQVLQSQAIEATQRYAIRWVEPRRYPIQAPPASSGPFRLPERIIDVEYSDAPSKESA